MKRLLFLMPLMLILAACFPGMPATTTTSGSPPVIVAFTASPVSISPGQQVTLIWNVTGASAIQIDQGVGSGMAAAGTISVTPGATTTYNLSANNSTGTVSSSVTVSVSSSPAPIPVPPPVPSPVPPLPPLPSPGLPPNIIVFDITPNVINVPPGPGAHSATMRWEVRNAAAVTIDGSPVAMSGSRVLTPPVGTHSFTLRAVNPNGTDVRTQVLRVNP